MCHEYTDSKISRLRTQFVFLIFLQVSHCHDSVVYILAPLKYVSMFGCSDSIIVLGAVGKVSITEKLLLILTGLVTVLE